MGTDKRARQKANRQLKYQQAAKVQRRRSLTRRVVIGVAAVVAAIALVVGLAWLGGSGGDDDEPIATAPSTALSVPTPTSVSVVPGSTVPAGSLPPPVIVPFAYGTGECPPADGADEAVREFDDAPQLCIDPETTYVARFTTSEGDIVVELDSATVPGTVNNFVTLARYGYYDDTSIFRADPSIDIIQGGGTDNGASPGYEIPDEGTGFSYEPGQLVMARTGAPNSAGGQWFFVGGPKAANLNGDGTYVVFGRVSEGLEIVQSIIGLAPAGGNGPPTTPVTVETVEIIEA